METIPPLPQPIKVIIFDDSPDIRDGFTSLFKFYDDIHVIGTYPDARNVEQIVKTMKPQVILMDINMPGITGIEATLLAKHAAPATEIIILSQLNDDNNIFEAIKAGATGYLLKGSDTDKVVAAIRIVAKGGSPINEFVARKALENFKKSMTVSFTPPTEQLSDREKEVLEWMCEGKTYKGIAAEMLIAVDTVRSHIRSIYEKLQVKSKTEAVLVAIRKKII
jgi:DNA-binding NarL/FixJ family response regulator